MKTIIKGGTVVNEGKVAPADIVVSGDTIESILPADSPTEGCRVIDAQGCYVLPGIIDEHVHFREPGLTQKADMDSESCAAAAGGVTSIFDMPNTVPQTTTIEALQQKQEIAAQKCHVNYAFFFGATNSNAHLFAQLDRHQVPGIKLFMGSSTGNMLVDGDEALHRVFSTAHDVRLPIMAHCEDTAIINRNMRHYQDIFGDDPEVWTHEMIRSEEACLVSTKKALQLAKKHKTQLHIAHVSTAAELELIPSNSLHTITAEATVGHLLFSTIDYKQLGTRIKVNPSIKSIIDQHELRQGLTDGRISAVATDHAPHLLEQKEGGSASAASGMPMIQFALPAMLELVSQRVLTIQRLVELMAHQPATIFAVRDRGFLRSGYKADITIVRPRAPWTVTTELILSKCGWSPLEGHEFQWRVEKTLCNGHLVYSDGTIDKDYLAQPILFR